MSGQCSSCPGKALGIKKGIADSHHANEMTKRPFWYIKIRYSGMMLCEGHLCIGSNR